MSFSLDLSKAVDNIKDHTEEVIAGTLFQVSANVIKRTPVGEPSLWKNPPPPGYVGGTLRNSWRATLGSPSTERNTVPNEGGSDSISSLTQTIGGFEMGDTFYLTNNMPYAIPVEYGSSSQVGPMGMVRVSLAEAQAVLDEQ